MRTIMILLVAGLIWQYWGKDYYHQHKSHEQVKVQSPSASKLRQTTSHSQFRCDGRTHCSQMHSCEEAKFFLNNCPNTKMDGNHDGVPCERQWCHI